MPSGELARHFFAATTSIMDSFVFTIVTLAKHRFRPLSYGLLIGITTQLSLGLGQQPLNPTLFAFDAYRSRLIASFGT